MKNMQNSKCAICGCEIHRDGDYAKPTIKGRSHASKHHYVAERFFGRSANRRGETRVPIFKKCPWNIEGETTEFCFDCHEELLHNPVLLPEDVKMLSELVKKRKINEENKTNDRVKLGERIKLFNEVISKGLKALKKQ